MTPDERRRAAEVLRSRMDQLNLTASELAQKADVDPTTVRAILRGERDPSTETRRKLAVALGWTLGTGLRLTTGARLLVDATNAEILGELANRLDN